MRILPILPLALVFAISAFAGDLDKSPAENSPGPPDPELLRQGGDTFADAFLIPDEFYDTSGTTTGYTHDYDEV